MVGSPDRMDTVLRIGNYDISEAGRGNSSCCQNIPSPALLQAPSPAVIAEAIRGADPANLNTPARHAMHHCQYHAVY